MPLPAHSSIRRGFLGRLGSAIVLLLSPRRASSQQSSKIAGFDHVAVPMEYEQAMVRFYRSLGFRVKEGTRICSVHFGDNKINFHRPSLWQNDEFTLRAPKAEPPCGDFCFVWTGSESELVETLAKADGEVIEGPVSRQGGRDGGKAEGTSRYIHDPDGNLLEFIIY